MVRSSGLDHLQLVVVYRLMKHSLHDLVLFGIILSNIDKSTPGCNSRWFPFGESVCPLRSHPANLHVLIWIQINALCGVKYSHLADQVMVACRTLLRSFEALCLVLTRTWKFVTSSISTRTASSLPQLTFKAWSQSTRERVILCRNPCSSQLRSPPTHRR